MENNIFKIVHTKSFLHVVDDADDDGGGGCDAHCIIFLHRLNSIKSFCIKIKIKRESQSTGSHAERTLRNFFN